MAVKIIHKYKVPHYIRWIVYIANLRYSLPENQRESFDYYITQLKRRWKKGDELERLVEYLSDKVFI